jgi:very-short-patch-repair endonuclease
MTRVKRGNVSRKRHKILKLAKGFRGAGSVQFRTSNQQVMKRYVHTEIVVKKNVILEVYGSHELTQRYVDMEVIVNLCII